MPDIDIDPERLHEFAVTMLRRQQTLSGVQQKLSVGLDQRSFALRVGLAGILFILKPASRAFPHLPENELVTMRLAEAAGLNIPPCGLVRLSNGTLAYITRRFDRTKTGGKLQQEDFCQLSLKGAKDKYRGSAELCFRIVHRYATAPLVDSQRLYRQFAFSWWAGNGDMHLKNLSLLIGSNGPELSPAYDLLSTRLVIPDDMLAIPIGGKRDNLTPRSWVALAALGQLPPKAAARALGDVLAAHPKADALLAASRLPEEYQERYSRLLKLRARQLETARDRLLAL